MNCSKYIAIFVLFLEIILLTPAFAQTANEELKRMVIIDDDTNSASRAMETAVAANKPDILLYALNNPSWGKKMEAIEAMGKLPRNSSLEAYIQVLKFDVLWSSRVRGGRGQEIQDAFVTTLKDNIKRSSGIDISSTNLFNLNERNLVMQKLTK